jgi:hypothetical protein
MGGRKRRGREGQSGHVNGGHQDVAAKEFPSTYTQAPSHIHGFRLFQRRLSLRGCSPRCSTGACTCVQRACRGHITHTYSRHGETQQTDCLEDGGGGVGCTCSSGCSGGRGCSFGLLHGPLAEALPLQRHEGGAGGPGPTPALAPAPASTPTPTPATATAASTVTTCPTAASQGMEG